MKLTPIHLEEIRLCILHGARAIKAKGKEVPPALILFNERPGNELGELTPIVLATGTKDEWAALQRHYARSPEFAAAVLVLECWTCALAPDEPLPDSVRGRSDRAEGLAVSVLTREEQYMLLATIRGATIEEAQFTRVSTSGPDRFEGRFIREAP